MYENKLPAAASVMNPDIFSSSDLLVSSLVTMEEQQPLTLEFKHLSYHDTLLQNVSDDVLIAISWLTQLFGPL